MASNIIYMLTTPWLDRVCLSQTLCPKHSSPRELSSVLCNDLEGSSDGGEGGREAQERRDICPRTDDSLRYTAETNNPGEQLCAVLRLVASAWLFAVLWTVAHQAPLSMEFSRQECWSGVPCPPPGDLPTQGSNQSLPHGRQILYCLSHQRGPGILEWVAIPSQGIFLTQELNLHCKQILHHLSHQGILKRLYSNLKTKHSSPRYTHYW